MAGRQDGFLLLSTSGTGTSNGAWFMAADLEIPFSLDFKGTGAGDTCEVRVSNDPTQPLDTAHERQLGAVVNTETTRAVTETYRWIKVRKTAATQSTSVWLQAHIRR